MAKGTKNILIIGRTGSGKSTLANLLVNKEKNFEKKGNFEEIFKESDNSISETEEIQSGEVEINGVKYRIIDTIGFGNTKLPDKEIAYKIFLKCHEFEEGLTQILFTIDGRITREEIKIYNIIKKKIFDESITEFTTIVRTKFGNFRNPDRRKEDIKKTKEEGKRNNKKIIRMFNSCNDRIIHVDNPSLISANEKEVESYKKRKEESRDVLVKYLEKFQQEESYEPDSLKLINRMLKTKYLCENELSKNKFKEDLEKKIKELKEQNIIKKISRRVTQGLGNDRNLTEEKVERSSLEATIEIRSKCIQM